MSYREDQPRVPAGQPGGGRWIKEAFDDYESSVESVIEQLESSIDEDSYAYYGIRVEDTQTPGKVGDELELSRVWIDGDPTDELLNGTSVLGLQKASVSGVVDRNEIDAAMMTMGLNDDTNEGYFGKVIYIVGGDSREFGEDPGEFVVGNAKIVAVYTRNKSAFSRIDRRL